MRSRSRVLLPLLLSGSLLVTACGGTGSEPATDDPTTAPPAADGTYPVTVATAFGDVTIERAPERVVTLGWSDAETALALGVEPVGNADWLSFGGSGVGPWAEELLTGELPLLGTLEPDLEAIAALDPDLILDTRSDGTQERYDALAQLGVPVIGPPPGVGPYLTTWEQQLELVAQALGRTDRAAQLEAELDARFEEVAAANPDFDGTSVAVGAYTSEGYGGYVRGDARVDFVERLGFVNTSAVEDRADGSSFFVALSEEQVDVLDAEVTVVFPIFVDASEFTTTPLWQNLAAVREGRAVVIDDPSISNAFSSGSVLGTGAALDTVPDLLADAVAGEADGGLAAG